MTKLEYIYNASFSAIVELTHDRKLLEKYLISPRPDADLSRKFVRKTPLSLENLLTFMIMPRAKSCQCELETFFSEKGYTVPTKSAFSMKRKLVSPGIFRYLNRVILEETYRHLSLRTWKRRLVIAVDGSTLTMPVGERFEPLYGSAARVQDKTRRLPTARATILSDVLNRLILDISLEKYGSHEPDSAYNSIMNLPDDIRHNAIFIFDRLYLSTWLLTLLQNADIQYVIRCKRGYSPAIDRFYTGGRRSADIQLDLSPSAWNGATGRRFARMGITPDKCRPIYLHLTKSQLPNGEVEVIRSNVRNVRLSPAQAYNLYGYRWVIETEIGIEKNEWQIEIFSGYSKVAILQDVYCKIISYNLCSMAMTEANKKMQRRLAHHYREKVEIDKAKPPECRYKVNVNIALFNFKFLIVNISVRKVRLHTLLLRYIAAISRYYEPYRPGITNPRNFRKYKLNGKYVTFTNYSRAL